MNKKTKIGIIICDRDKSCGGGKCFRALANREGAFDIYSKDEEVEVVGYSSCGGCPGGNIETVPEEMKKNGAEVIHLTTGFVVGYPPCPYITHFREMIKDRFGLKVVVGTHPIPQKYIDTHTKLGTWNSVEWDEIKKAIMATEKIRIAYN
ncbi:MAG: CGGC domain-containing protein [Bacteroidales bacterium]|jgi:predicted metal-binding protein|nr:CGGC domain-containing protein [Bacteroidales bacterium]